MASVQDFTFSNMSRIGNDTCGINESDLQNVQHGNYMLTNHFANDCAMKKPIDFALSQPNVNFTGSHQVGMGGCNIDTNSALLVKKVNASNKCKLNLQERPYKTVPYLGKGTADPTMETQLLQGDAFTNRKSVNPSSEICYTQYSNYPLLPSIKDSVANPGNLIEDAADSNWIRGGLPSRELTRDNNT